MSSNRPLTLKTRKQRAPFSSPNPAESPTKASVFFAPTPNNDTNHGAGSIAKPYLTRAEVAEHYPISIHTLAKLASQRRGPRFYKPTDKALYRPDDVEAWIEAAAVMPLAEPPPAFVRQTGPLPRHGRGRASPPRKEKSASAPTRNGRKSLKPSPNSFLLRPKG